MAKINFYLPQKSQIKLAVFDLLGREILPMMNSTCAEGWHSVPLDGTHFSSGLYFVQLKSDTGCLTKKILFTR